MKFLRIVLFTLIFAFAGFVLGYVLFAQYGGEFIPLKAIFWGTKMSDMVVEATLMIKTKLLGATALFGFIGLVVVVLLERGGGRPKKRLLVFTNANIALSKQKKKHPSARLANGMRTDLLRKTIKGKRRKN